MILNANPSRKPSRAGFWIVLGLGALLLPLAPGAARTRTPEEPQGAAPKDRGADRIDAAFLPLDNFHVREAFKMKICAACHEPQSVHGHDLQRKPQSWKEAHDEIIRLMDEVRRLQGQLGDSAKQLPPVAEQNRDEQIENLQDEIELLKVQVRLKEAHVAATKGMLAEYQRDLLRFSEINRKHQGSISPNEINKLRLSVKTQQAQLTINEAELQEPLVRLKQAERRLSRLQRPAERSSVRGEEKLKELERKIESLQKEIRDLRREMKPKKPDGPGQSVKEASGDQIWKKLGLRLRPVGADVVKGIAGQFRGGLIVTEVRPDSPAQRADLHKGDILVGLHKFEILSDVNVHYVLSNPELTSSQPLKFYVLRDKQLQDGKLQLGE